MLVDDQGCTNTVTLPLTVFPAPTPDTIAWSPSLEICDGDIVTLIAPAGVGYTYLWSTGATTPTISVATSGTYGVIVLDVNDCELIPDPVDVLVYPLPPASISGPDVICDAGCIDLNAPLGLGYTYQWYENGGTLIPGATSSMLTVCDNTLLPPYTVEVTDQNNCTAQSGPFNVLLATSPFFTIDVVPDSCEGSISTLSVMPVQADVVYTWSTGEIGTSIMTAQAGLYSVIGRDTLTGCSYTATATIYPLPDLCLVPVGCYEICNPDTICGPEGLEAYQWNLDGIPIAGANGQCLIVNQSGTYSLTGTTSFGCEATSDSLMLTVIDCSCDALQVSAKPSPTDSCCWTLSYQNDYSGDLYGMQIYTNDADLTVSPGSVDDSLMVASSTSNSVGLTHSVVGSPIVKGSLNDFLELCLTDVINTPQQVIIDWYDFNIDIVCSDTLFFECPVEPDCLYLQSDSIYCEGDKIIYEMTVCNPIDADFDVGYIDLLALSPPGVVLSPPSIDISTNPILAGDCRTFSIVLSGPNLEGSTFCYNFVAHDQVPLVDTALCCSLDTMYCIDIPDCDPCDDIRVAYVEPLSSGEDGCCYSIGLSNNYQAGVFDGISLCMLSPNTTMTMNNPFGSGWITTTYTPTVIDVQVSPPIGSTLPLGTSVLPDLCIQTEQAPDQMVEIKWLMGDSVLCRDTVLLGCEPPCGYIFEDAFECTSSGWTYSGIIKNTSMFTMGEAHIAFTAPSGMSIYDAAITLGSLLPGGTFPFSIPVGPPAVFGDTLCFTVALHELGDNGNHTNCCNFNHCAVLPDCPQALVCACDETFASEVAMGIDCLSPSDVDVLNFAPAGQLDDCDQVIWFNTIAPDDVIVTNGNEVASLSFNNVGPQTLCMRVNRTTPDGTSCSEEVCKTFVEDQSEYAEVLSLYPNPASEVVIVEASKVLPENINVYLIDLWGRSHPLSYSHVTGAAQQVEVNVHGVTPGVYWLRLEGSEIQWQEKLIINR